MILLVSTRLHGEGHFGRSILRSAHFVKSAAPDRAQIADLYEGWDGTWSSRGDVPPPAGFKPIFSYQVANDYITARPDHSGS
jgi:hypothetical protein